MENEAENKHRVEERTRKALIRYGGDIEKTREVLEKSLEYVSEIYTKMKADFQESPTLNLQIAASVTQEIVTGRNQRKQVLQDMLNSLENREQLWVCVKCGTEVIGVVVDSNVGEVYQCPQCVEYVNRILKDRGDIYDQKQSLLARMMVEDDKLLTWMERMGWTGVEPQPGPTTVIQNRQQVLVLSGDKIGKKQQEVIDEIRHLPPLEAEKLRQDLKKEMITIDEDIRIEEQEIEKAEE